MTSCHTPPPPPVPNELANSALSMHLMERAILMHMEAMIGCQNMHIADAYVHISAGRIAEARKELRDGLDHHKTAHKLLVEACAERDRLHEAAITLCQQEHLDHVAETDPVAAKVAADFMKKL